MKAEEISLIISIIALVLSTIIAVITIIVSVLINRAQFKKDFVCIEKLNNLLQIFGRLMDDYFGNRGSGERDYDALSKALSEFRLSVNPLRFVRPKLFRKLSKLVMDLDDDLATPGLNRSKDHAFVSLKRISKTMGRYYKSLL